MTPRPESGIFEERDLAIPGKEEWKIPPQKTKVLVSRDLIRYAYIEILLSKIIICHDDLQQMMYSHRSQEHRACFISKDPIKGECDRSIISERKEPMPELQGTKRR